MRNSLLISLAVIITTNTAYAQNCPAGIPSAGNPLCIPPDRENSPYYQNSNSSVRPQRRWRLTWGAIATDTKTGDVGTVVGELSEQRAKREAINLCQEYGASGCKVKLSFHNQCAAVAWAYENEEAVGGAAVFQGGPTINIASELAVSECKRIRNGRDCRIIYSECTVPILSQ